MIESGRDAVKIGPAGIVVYLLFMLSDGAFIEILADRRFFGGDRRSRTIRVRRARANRRWPGRRC
jgi:hypothetical protein